MRPIPPRMLRHTVTLRVPTGMDAYHVVQYEDVLLNRVCLQRSLTTNKRNANGAQNTEAAFSATLFVDARLSTPKGIDLDALKRRADAAGSDLHVLSGGSDYVVKSVEVYLDDRAQVHHYEAGLV